LFTFLAKDDGQSNPNDPKTPEGGLIGAIALQPLPEGCADPRSAALRTVIPPRTHGLMMSITGANAPKTP